MSTMFHETCDRDFAVVEVHSRAAARCFRRRCQFPRLYQTDRFGETGQFPGESSLSGSEQQFELYGVQYGPVSQYSCSVLEL